jgi:NitT/TauT family transport system ATP-binding protein
MDQVSMNLRLVSARQPTVQERPVDARPFINLESVSLAYDADADGLTLDRVSMGIGQGEFVAVVGPSGCGKSTLMKLVTGLLPTTSGEVTVDGKVVRRPIKGVGMAFQNATLLPWRTTLKNVMLPLEIVQPFKSERRRKRAEHAARAQAMLNAVGLGAFAAKFPWQLSGGMQQRASLCRALVHEPKLLMLDEPFAALDAFTREELWGVMQALWLQHGFSVILVTHDLREAVYLADRVFVMSKKPARIIFERKIDLPRPRTVEGSFEPHFIDLVHELRGKIIEARS